MSKTDKLAENALALARGGLCVPDRHSPDQDSFTWWPYRLPQRIWVERAPEIGSRWPIRLCAESLFMRDCPIVQGSLETISTLNSFAVLSCLHADFRARTISLRSTIYLTEDSLVPKAPLIGAALGLQPGMTERWADTKVPELLGGTIAFSTDRARPAGSADPIVDFAIKEVRPKGQGPSRFDATDFESLRQIDMKPWFEVDGSDDRFEARLMARGTLFATLTVAADIVNPNLGSGVLILLSLSEELTEQAASAAAALLNAREADDWTGYDVIGAWCKDNRGGKARVTWVTFVPSSLRQAELLRKIVEDVAMRAVLTAMAPPTSISGADLVPDPITRVFVDARDSDAETPLCRSLRDDPHKVDEITKDPSLWRSLTKRELHLLTLFAILDYGRTSDEKRIPGLMKLYEYFHIRATFEERMEILGEIKPLVESRDLAVCALLPFLLSDLAPAIIATATIEFAHAHPRDNDDPLTGPKLLLEYYQKGWSRDPVALFAGLAQLGDRRVFRLLEPFRPSLGDEQIVRLGKLHSGFPYVAAVEFFLDWIEQTDDVREPTRFAYLCRAVDTIRERAITPPGKAEPEVTDVERVLPSPRAGEGPSVIFLKRYKLSDYAQLIAPRLRAIADKEHGEKLIPQVMETWGLRYD